eukprot:m.235245 g.235245  ORF g.235245 m.235245 type:complete len:416 (-) comp17400_c0_seq13:3090-4337(-)
MASVYRKLIGSISLPTHARRVVVGMSGGVDSSVTAAVLKELGYDVTGVFMKNWDEREETGDCPAARDAEDCSTICKALNIPFYQVDFVKRYWNDVFLSMLNDYENGFTPNPDVACNQHIKFDAFFKHARSKYQCDYVATGHYARCSYQNGYFRLLSGIDPNKDQSYFLAGLPHEILKQTLFPLGNLTKPEVYQLARDLRLPSKVLTRKESMGVCFVGKRRFPQFLSQYLDDRPGDVINASTGKVLGTHSGAYKYTIGQNPRLGSVPTKQYVVGKDMKTSTLYTSSNANDQRLFATQLLLGDVRWTRPDVQANQSTFARIRHRAKLVPVRLHTNTNDVTTTAAAAATACGFATITGYHPEISSLLRFQHALKHAATSYIADFNDPVKAAVAGQYVVLYQGEECVGRGRILAVNYCN